MIPHGHTISQTLHTSEQPARQTYASRQCVTMATHGKHSEKLDKDCQTQNNQSITETDLTNLDKKAVFSKIIEVTNPDVFARVMYDETVEVDAKEIDSPDSSGSEGVVKAAMAKFNPPVRHTARQHFDTESDSDSEHDKFLGNLSEEDQSPDRKSDIPDKLELHRQLSKEVKISKPKPPQKRADTSNSDSDSGDIEAEAAEAVAGVGRRRAGGVVIPAEGAYDPKQFQDLKVPPDMENVFQYIMKYTPQKIDIELKLQPFVPEYVPAVGDIDAFLKVATPPRGALGSPLADPVLDFIDNLGLALLDEPAAAQSDAALLHLQLRAVSKSAAGKATVLTKKIDNAEKNSKAIDRWIKDVSELHLSKPPPTVNYTNKMPDIDSLMEEWPEVMEESLNEAGFPPATLDCSLAQYVDLICAMFDIPVHGDSLNARIQALHLLFSLYSAVKNSQLYVDRQKDEKEKEKAET